MVGEDVVGGGGGGEVEDDVAEDYVGRPDVEAVGGAVEGVGVEGGGEGGEVREVVGEEAQFLKFDGREGGIGRRVCIWL